jgi:hypothetical protein
MTSIQAHCHSSCHDFRHNISQTRNVKYCAMRRPAGYWSWTDRGELKARLDRYKLSLCLFARKPWRQVISPVCFRSCVRQSVKWATSPPPTVAHTFRYPTLNYVNAIENRCRTRNFFRIRKSRAMAAFVNSSISHLPSIRDGLHVLQSPQRWRRRPANLSIASPRACLSTPTAVNVDPVAPQRKHASPAAERQGTRYHRLVILTRQRYPRAVCSRVTDADVAEPGNGRRDSLSRSACSTGRPLTQARAMVSSVSAAE